MNKLSFVVVVFLLASFAAKKPLGAGSSSLNVLSYNVYLLPKFFNTNQYVRATHIPLYLSGADVVVLQEAFLNAERKQIKRILREFYPYSTKVLGSDGLFTQDGGVIIFSKYEIIESNEVLFGSECAYSDCYADKGVLYAKIKKDDQHYHIFGTHLQAESDNRAKAIRLRQLEIFKNFIKDKAISVDEAVILAGDFNIDRRVELTEYEFLISFMQLERPQFKGLPYSYDSLTNAYAQEYQQHLDYIFVSKVHRRSSEIVNKIWGLKTPAPHSGSKTDLSDHYPIVGHLSF